MEQSSKVTGNQGASRASAMRQPSPSKHNRSSSNASALPQMPANDRDGEKYASSKTDSAKGSVLALERPKSVQSVAKAGADIRDLETGKNIKLRGVSSSRNSIEGDASCPVHHGSRHSSRMAPPSSFPGSRSGAQSRKAEESIPPSHPRLSDAASSASSRSTSNGSQSATSATASSRRRESMRSSLSTGAATRPKISESRYRRSFSTAAKDTSHPASRTTISRNSFTTYQQDFMPQHSSRNRTSSVATVASGSGSNSTDAAASTTHRKQQSRPHQSHQPQAFTTATLRQQTHLLHLSLLHAANTQTLKAFNASARSGLSQRFTDLQTLYKSVLALRRTARQNANFLALHDWSGGNTQSLVRKLSVLTGILAELCDLTRPEPPTSINNASTLNTAVPASIASSSIGIDTELPQEEGHYSLIASAFSLWVAWVAEVWAERDVVRFTSTEVLGEMQRPPDSAMLPIEGLGDGMKGEIKGLMARVEEIAARLDGLGVKAVAGDGGRARGRSVSPIKGLGIDSAGVEWEKSTPGVLIGLAGQLVKGMREELQVMREIEFEVLIGEKAWLEEQVRRAGQQVEHH